MYSLTTLLVAVLTFVPVLRVLAQEVTTLSYDTNYDNGGLSLGNLACSDGVNGLEAKYPTLSTLPTFPNVGGLYTVSWNSTECGTCYAVTYGTTTVNILAVDRSENGFTVSQGAMNTLTGGQAATLGTVYVSYVSVPPSVCGM
ncbi:Asp f 13-like protein [Boletus coccyginus]|nr:Asp f 13-like protein [Boletus coccyginus]